MFLLAVVAVLYRMKKLYVLLAIFIYTQAMQEIPLITPPLIPRQSLVGELKDHALEISIAGLYLAGGIPYFSDTARWACDISGSLLWLTTSLYSCISTVSRRRRLQKTETV